jgi:murein L,D-transpeptidase YcbB/YkuD
MKILSKFVSYCSACKFSYPLLFIILWSLSVIACDDVHGRQDSTAQAILSQFKRLDSELYFPNTVRRFYRENGNRLTWVYPDSLHANGWEALLLLDCVIQFGLSHDDYHPGQLLSVEMHRLIRNYDLVSAADKAAFDILLTDAMVTFMNHLHYGKLNPVYNSKTIDDPQFRGFPADRALRHALRKKDFMSAVLAVQPQAEAYRLLQSRMRLMKGQYVGDCYEAPEAEVRKIAINMERLRWAESKDELNHIQFNIPSHTLTFLLTDTAGKYFLESSQTDHQLPMQPTIISRIKVARYGHQPVLTLNFVQANVRQQYTIKKDVAKFATVLLQTASYEKVIPNVQQAISIGKTKTFKLPKPLAIQLTYITCADVDGLVVTYEDKYQLDKALEAALYTMEAKKTIAL